MVEYRKEYKYLLRNFEVYGFLKCFEGNIVKLHENRFIKSLYFDTINLSLYKESAVNDSDKKKVRIRQYNNETNYFKEIKYNNKKGKSKTVNQININNFSDIDYLEYENYILHPVLYVSYTRQYYRYKDLRLTLDEDIKYTTHSFRTLNEISHNIDNSIVEYKLNNEEAYIEKYFLRNPTAFSKYQNAVSTLYFKN